MPQFLQRACTWSVEKQPAFQMRGIVSLHVSSTGRTLRLNSALKCVSKNIRGDKQATQRQNVESYLISLPCLTDWSQVSERKVFDPPPCWKRTRGWQRGTHEDSASKTKTRRSSDHRQRQYDIIHFSGFTISFHSKSFFATTLMFQISYF